MIEDPPDVACDPAPPDEPGTSTPSPVVARADRVPTQRSPTETPAATVPTEAAAPPPQVAEQGGTPEPVEAARRPGGRRRGLVVGAVAAILVVGLVVALGFPRAASGRLALGRAPVAVAETSPFEAAIAVLSRQAQSLVGNDEAGWLAAVDPENAKLRSRYKMIFESLHRLDIDQFFYRPHLLSDPADATLTIDADIAYCFTGCSRPGVGSTEAPSLHQRLTIGRVDGRLVITAMTQPKQGDQLAPAPWEATTLEFRRGARVTVAGPESEARNLDKILAIAENAAALEDRFAAYVSNPQARYRVYLADDAAWRRWYGGMNGNGVLGYSLQLGDSGTDVVLRASSIIHDPTMLAVTIKHEMGHVVTLSGLNTHAADQMWLSEGIAEYIGWWPKPPTMSLRLPSVRTILHGSHRPTTIALPAPPASASAREVDAFYGLGQFATSCMAHFYGERKLFDFVRIDLQEGLGLDNAARQAFGKPFATVDKTCVAWIRQQAG